MCEINDNEFKEVLDEAINIIRKKPATSYHKLHEYSTYGTNDMKRSHNISPDDDIFDRIKEYLMTEVPYVGFYSIHIHDGQIIGHEYANFISEKGKCTKCARPHYDISYAACVFRDNNNIVTTYTISDKIVDDHIYFDFKLEEKACPLDKR